MYQEQSAKPYIWVKSMPKRSNEFQKLVFLLKQQLADGAIVSESRMLNDVVTGTEREVDIHIETVISSHPVTVSIECIDRKRAADVKWVEEMKAKHERLPTNALVLISRKGFSSEAIKVAKIYNIQTLTFDETTEDDIDRIFDNLDSLWSKVFTLTPTKVIVRMAATGKLPAENIAVFPDNIIYAADGRIIAIIRDLIQSWLQSGEIKEEFAKKGDQSHKSFVIGCRQPKDKEGKSLYLQKLSPRILRRIELIETRGVCEFEVSRFPLRHGALGDVKVSWGEGKFMGKNAILLASKDEHGTERISITVEDKLNEAVKKLAAEEEHIDG